MLPHISASQQTLCRVLPCRTNYYSLTLDLSLDCPEFQKFTTCLQIMPNASDLQVLQISACLVCLDCCGPRMPQTGFCSHMSYYTIPLSLEKHGLPSWMGRKEGNFEDNGFFCCSKHSPKHPALHRRTVVFWLQLPPVFCHLNHSQGIN